MCWFLRYASTGRHSLVQRIIQAYGETDKEAEQRDLLQRALRETDEPG